MLLVVLETRARRYRRRRADVLVGSAVCCCCRATQRVTACSEQAVLDELLARGWAVITTLDLGFVCPSCAPGMLGTAQSGELAAMPLD